MRAENARLQARVHSLTDRLLMCETSAASAAVQDQEKVGSRRESDDAPTPLEVKREQTLSELATLVGGVSE
jgi:hypothetical protein